MVVTGFGSASSLEADERRRLVNLPSTLR